MKTEPAAVPATARAVSKLVMSRLYPPALVALGVVIAALARPAPQELPLPPEADRRRLFEQLTKDEPAERERALEDWPHHRWSQQDGFGAFELERVSRFSREQGTTMQALFLLIDEGLRNHWPGPDGKPLDATTVPLKPRPMD